MGLEKTLFIVNPTKSNKEFKKIYASFPGEKEFVLTEYAGHATKIAKEAAKDFKTIVSVGGDGTLNEVINGAYGYDVEFAALPFGSGNDFLRTLGIRNYKQASESIISGNIIKVDLGLAEFRDEKENEKSRYYINMASLGIGPLVISNMKDDSKKAYLPCALKTIIKNKPFDAEVWVDGKVVHNGYFWDIQVNNGKYVGGGMKATPEADIADNELDIMIAKGMSKANLLCTFLLIYPGWHKIHPSVEFYRGERIEVYPDIKDKIGLILDGELVGYAPAKFDVIPNAIKFRYIGAAERVKEYEHAAERVRSPLALYIIT